MFICTRVRRDAWDDLTTTRWLACILRANYNRGFENESSFYRVRIFIEFIFFIYNIYSRRDICDRSCVNKLVGLLCKRYRFDEAVLKMLSLFDVEIQVLYIDTRRCSMCVMRKRDELEYSISVSQLFETHRLTDTGV